MKLPLFVAMLLAPLAWASASQEANPARLLSAKTACIHQLNGTAKDLAAARKELTTWGRFKLVDSCSAADIAVWISARYSAPDKVCGARVQVLGAADNAILWSGSQGCKTRTDLAIGQLVRQLKADVTKTKK